MSAPTVTHRIVRQSEEHHTTERRTKSGELVERHFTVYVRKCSCDQVFRSFTEEGAEWHYLRHLGNPNQAQEGQSDE